MRHKRFIFPLLLAIVGVAGAIVWTAQDDLFGSAIDAGTPPPASKVLSPEEAAFYDYVAPRLRSVAAEAQALADLGETKSRNLIELQRRGNRVDELGGEIDGYAAGGVPERFAPAFQRYQVGIEAVRRAMDETRSAFASFDWDRVARAVNIMDAGATNLGEASDELEQVAGGSVAATPGM